MWPSRQPEHKRLVTELSAAQATQGLLGLPDIQTIETLAMQVVASLRRETYYRLVQRSLISPARANPNSQSFDAERAVAFHMQQGNIDEAAWLIFLMTHFARRPDSGWRRLQDVYGMLGAGLWDWQSVTADPAGFDQWLTANWMHVGGAFGNHRKYESMRPDANRSMQRTVADYLAWIGRDGHANFFAAAVIAAGNDPHTIFDYLYKNMGVCSFGRLAKFDYLSLIGRYGLAPIQAGSAYLDGATGPGNGARLLIDGRPDSGRSNSDAQQKLDVLDARLKVGMTVMEDALCNWQKSPRAFIHFVG